MYLSTKIYECISRLFILYVYHAPKQNDVILMQYHRKAVGERNLFNNTQTSINSIRHTLP
jgi:hypothetical protein